MGEGEGDRDFVFIRRRETEEVASGEEGVEEGEEERGGVGGDTTDGIEGGIRGDGDVDRDRGREARGEIDDEGTDRGEEFLGDELFGDFVGLVEFADPIFEPETEFEAVPAEFPEGNFILLRVIAVMSEQGISGESSVRRGCDVVR